MTHIFRRLSIPIVLALLLASLAPAAQALDKPGRMKIMPAVVQVWWIWEEGDELKGTGMGSGTIVSPDGLVLTNHHVAFPEDELGVKYLGIALTARSDRPPQPAYIAEVAADDPSLDLTVLRVSLDLDLRPIRPGQLNLPYVPVGDSEALDVGDELNIFGYPGIGGDTVTFTRGVVSGFTLEAAVAGRAWVKTDTTIAGGNSGGTAVDENGFLVGVPTRAGAGGDAAYVDCRPLADTNRDGQTDDSDTCIPIGGFLNALRPINLAKPLIEAARQGLAYQGQGSQPANSPAAAGRPRIDNLQFSTGVSESDQPTNLVTSLPSGSRSLYLFFDYENMVDGTPWEVRMQVDGQDVTGAGMPAREWAGGASGNWWVGWSDTDFPDGAYTFQVVVDGRALADAQITIGGRAKAGPSLSNIVFSQQVDNSGQPVEPTRLFPAGVKQLYAVFDYANMTNGLEWTRTWLYEGEVAATATERWDAGKAGQYLLELTSDTGLDAGNWRLELAVQGQLAARADFTVTGGQGAAAQFQPFVFADEVDQNTGQPIHTGTAFPAGTKALYVFSDYQGMQDGLRAVSRVYLNGQLVIESPFEWSNEFYGGANGTWWNAIHANGGALPDGEYTQELEVAGQVVQSGSAMVGSGGSQPARAPAPSQPADGVQIQGVIIDADTGRPIPGAFFVVLKPGITVAAFQWTDDEVYTMTEADRQGAYKLPLPLERGQCYSLIIGAEGYWPHTEDNVCIPKNAASAADIPVQLQKR